MLVRNVGGGARRAGRARASGRGVERSVEAALFASLPQTAEEQPPSAVAVRAAHRQAWKLSGLEADDPWRAVLEETDPVERVLLGDRWAWSTPSWPGW